MAEYSLIAFSNMLFELFYYAMPYESDDIKFSKHPNTPLHIRDVALKNNGLIAIDENTMLFELGNEESEEFYPYYHILEDAQVIKKRERANKKTRGSQSELPPKERNYNIYKIDVDSKGRMTQNYEYKKNVRGKRTKIDEQGLAKDSDSYVNRHYRYIERILDGDDSKGGILPEIAEYFGIEYLGGRNKISESDILGASNIDDLPELK